jgi:hypothetical protein
MTTAGKWGETRRSSRATDSAPYLRWGQTVEGDRLSAVGLLMVVAEAALVVVIEGSGRRGNLFVEVRGEVGSRSGPFIGARRGLGEIFLSFAELQWPAMEVREKIPVWTPAAGFSVDWVLCELTHRAGLLWPVWR